jgi:hypothetical protein
MKILFFFNRWANCRGRLYAASGKLALNRLRAVRSGGHQWTAIEAMDQLRSLDFGLVETVSPSPALLFVLGQRAKGAN